MLRDNLLTAYPTQVHLYFKEFPLEKLHPWSKAAAIAAAVSEAERRRILGIPRLDFRAPDGDHAGQPQGESDGVGARTKRTSTPCNSASAWIAAPPKPRSTRISPKAAPLGVDSTPDAVHQRPPAHAGDGMAPAADHHRLRDRISEDRQECGRGLRLLDSNLDLPGAPQTTDAVPTADPPRSKVNLLRIRWEDWVSHENLVVRAAARLSLPFLDRFWRHRRRLIQTFIWMTSSSWHRRR